MDRITNSHPVTAWLQRHDFAHCVPSFEANRITADLLADLTDADLRELGMSALGDRKRFLRLAATASFDHPPAARERTDFTVEPAGGRDTGVAAPAALAERRQLSVVFCDLVEATRLSSTLDPEDLRAVLRTYHDAVALDAARFEGFVAQYLGDGVLIYFGYPQAHEDDAERAVRASLAIVERVRLLQPRPGVRLETRIGIATGMVVVEEIGRGTPGAEFSATGETPNLAARLQAVAGPGQVVLAGATRQLLGSAFELAALGRRPMKGLGNAVEVWQAVRARDVPVRFQSRHPGPEGAIVGRESELAVLQQRWADARAGHGSALIISGEAGLGKSRLCSEFCTALATDTQVSVMQWQCSPYFSGTPLYPVARHWHSSCQVLPQDSARQRSEKLRGWLISQGWSHDEGRDERLASLLAPDAGPNNAGAGAQGRQTDGTVRDIVRDLVGGLRAATARRPAVLLVEDVHWIDATSLDLLAELTMQLEGAALLVVMTCRPEFGAPWPHADAMTRLTLSRLNASHTQSLAMSVGGAASLSEADIAAIVARSDGVPLYIEELARSMVEGDERHTGRAPADTMLPATLHDLLRARLDRLGGASAVAQTASVIGRSFGLPLLTLVSLIPEPQIRAALQVLVDAGMVHAQPGAGAQRYAFRHALMRDAAYESLLRSERVRLHRAVGSALELSAARGETVAAELLAMHFRAGEQPALALAQFSKAGAEAMRRGASREAADSLRSALALVDASLAGSEAAERRLELTIQLGNALLSARGYAAPETRECWGQAQRLARDVGDTGRLIQALVDGALVRFAAGEFSAVLQSLALFDDESSRMAPETRAPFLLTCGVSLFHQGLLVPAGDALDAALALVRTLPEAGRPRSGTVDLQIPCSAYAARSLAYRGHVSSAGMILAESLDYARHLGNLPALCWSLSMTALFKLMCGEPQQALVAVGELSAIARQAGMPTRASIAQIYEGEALLQMGDPSAALPLLWSGLRGWRRSAGLFLCSEYATRIAGLLLDARDPEAAREFVAYAESVEADSEERFCHAELIRMQGRLLGLAGDSAAARVRYQQAADVATGQGARLFAMRALCDLNDPDTGGIRGHPSAERLHALRAEIDDGFDCADFRRARRIAIEH